MKVTVLVKATADSEAGVMPTAQLIAGLARFKEMVIRQARCAGQG